MIAYGCPVTRPADFERFAQPGLTRAAEADSLILADPSSGSIFDAYNALLDRVAGREDLEALVLLHQDVEIVDDAFPAKVRAALADPLVGVVGCVGARDVTSMAWWEGSVTWASFTHRYYEHGGGAIPAFAMDPERTPLPDWARTGEVDSLDGFILVLSPWSVRNLRFDVSLGQRLHGYDFDFCRQVRAAGRKVLTADLKVVHHHSLELIADPENWIDAHVALARKWGAADAETDWRERALRAEAEAAAARTLQAAAQMQANARVAELQRELEGMRASSSWRLTAPLRAVMARLRARRRAP